MAASMVPLNIVSALKKAVDYLGASGWSAKTDRQRQFIHQFYGERYRLHLFNERELRAWADTVAENLNRILAEEGFSLTFDPFKPGEFGVLSILDVAVAWLEEGMPLPYFGRLKRPGVRMNRYSEGDGKATELFYGLSVSSHQHPIAVLPTKSGDMVYMTIAGEALGGFELIERIEKIRSSERHIERCSHLFFPMVDFEETKSLDWLLGLATAGAKSSFEVAAAAQQTAFKMNQVGARVKDVTTLTMRVTSALMGPPPLVIDEPFLLWIERPGLRTPILYGYFDESVWKDPGSLDR